MVKRKVKEWLKRYLPAEIVGTVTALVAASLTHFFYSNLIVVAYVGSLGEAIGFYSTVITQRVIDITKKNNALNKVFSVSDFTKMIGNVILEFGPAGMLDGLVLRPFFMFIFPSILKNFTIGILVGKFVGDITFYLLVIISYEIKKVRDAKQLSTKINKN